jgi:hypothetical protein
MFHHSSLFSREQIADHNTGGECGQQCQRRMLPGRILKLFHGTCQLVGEMLNIRFRFERLRLASRVLYRLLLSVVLIFLYS